jgi:hypothetical protein
VIFFCFYVFNLIFFISLNIFIFIGLFYIGGSFYPSEFINITFRNIIDWYNYSNGGVLCINTSSDINMTIDRCIFVSCNGYEGGGIFLYNPSPLINIMRCRFENNTAEYGNDIYDESKSSSCLPSVISDTCTTSDKSKSVICNFTSKSVITTPCIDKIVYFYFLFLFIIFFYFYISFFVFRMIIIRVGVMLPQLITPALITV